MANSTGAAAPPHQPLFPPGQWVRLYTDKREISQQWYDWGNQMGRWLD